MATLSSVQEAFGLQSRVFGNCFKIMLNWFREAKKYGEVQVSEEQWKRFLSIAYGEFKADDSVFVIHTYLSVFAKLLAYALITKTETQEEEKLQNILSGDEFTNLHIVNFVENDFFHWVKDDRNFKNLLPAIRLINSEIATFDFSVIEEDILKGVYQELIDVDTRHALGEYYTPDWLCDRVVSEYPFKLTDRILDPSCGSGSFLRASIQKLIKDYPAADANKINACVYGIDIHPLSVQIAKTTVLLSLGEKLKQQNNTDKPREPLRLNVLMANTLMSPKGTTSLFGDEFKILIDRKVLSLNTKILESSEMFDKGLEWCDDMAKLHLGKKGFELEQFRDSYKKALNGGSSTEYQSFFEIYKNLKSVKENNRDTIWKFIISNLYRPFFMFEKFDYIIGNPPWFTFSSVKNEEYKDALEKSMTYLKSFEKKTGALVYIGEFQSVRWAPNGNQWVKDVAEIITRNGWSWTYFAYKPDYNFWNPMMEVKNPKEPKEKWELKDSGKDAEIWQYMIKTYFSKNKKQENN
jgi:methylase of polypeptide subunit release factors